MGEEGADKLQAVATPVALPAPAMESDEGGWRDSVATAKEASDNVVRFVSEMLARHGWTAIFLVVVWYNCKDPVKRRYRKWKK